jgi:hypothetical protein
MYSLGRDIASEICVVSAGPRTNATAGGAGNNVPVLGAAIDVTILPSPSGAEGPTRYQTVCFALPATTTLGANDTLLVAAAIETSGSANFATFTTLVASETVISAAGPAGGGTLEATGKIGCSLENALQYVRLAYTPLLSAANTDLVDVGSVAIFAGSSEMP